MSNTISVTGTGSASGPPDQATVDIGVDVLGQSVAAVRNHAADAMSAIIAALRNRGVGDSDLATTGYSINPEYDHRDGRRLRGYRVVATVQARVFDLDGLGDTIDAAASAGGDSVVVRGLRFGHQDDGTLEARARAAAWSDARSKAEQLADLAGVELGSATAISEQRDRSVGPMPRAMAMEAAGSTPIEAGDLAVGVSIQVEFAIG